MVGTMHFKAMYLLGCSYGFKIPRW
ncbi:hypothetical protein ALT1000_210002 [Alteromonas macleodii]